MFRKKELVKKRELLGERNRTLTERKSIFGNAPKPDDITFLTPSIELKEDKLKFGHNRFVRQYYLVKWPRKVKFDALRTIYDFPADIDVSVHIHPQDDQRIVNELTKDLTKVESTYMKAQKDGDRRHINRLQRHFEDLEQLRDAIESGEEKLFYVSVIVSISAETEQDLDSICHKFLRQMGGRKFVFIDAYKRQDEAFFSVMPLGADRIQAFSNLESTAVAELFPFTSSKFSHKVGIPLGRDLASRNLFLFNPFEANDQMFNPNIICFAPSGSGKSFLIKLMILRALTLGYRVVILDPQGEYKKLVRAVNGQYIDLSLYSHHKINPCDVEAVTEIDEESGEKITSVFILGKVADMVNLTKFMATIGGHGNLDGTEINAIENAWKKTYADFGITDDPDSLYEPGQFINGTLQTKRKKTMPIFSDFYHRLSNFIDSKDLLAALERFKAGGTMGMFDYPSNVDLNARVIALNLKPIQSSGDLWKLGMNFSLAWIKENFVKIDSNYYKGVVADESQEFLKDEDTGQFMDDSYRQFRKWGCSAIALSQSYETFENSKHGRAMIQNAGSSFLLRQQKADLPLLAERYHLTEGERDFLIRCRKGQVLIKTMTETAFIETEPTMIESEICSTTKKVGE